MSAGDPARRSPLRTALLAVIGVGLLLLGGGLAVALGVGRDAQPAADSVDAGFARDMSRHHLQGVEMANLVADRSDDPEIELLAFDISATQTNQAGRMQGWLSLWGVPPTGGDTMGWMPADHGHDGHDMAGGALMPGMATQEELAELRSLSGTEFDVEFLRLMIRHHQGGFDMAAYAAENAEVQAVRDLARSMVRSQGAEVETMTSMLAARGGTPLPEP
ncbi:DUF305 domain-containing protein [Blastococcus sp. KM273128]|uniref:DUF305 domain-containing protein n=1 Tax=Blastococcus sp. KM273128 TaxID=2570314 RepID=UPI001F189232|nr:DUF305 domain-containing protein [Blastococcus sp. KM273128]MCF6743266.1 DUF305 domain-containing protein [Blastococcus sp. KM273128]